MTDNVMTIRTERTPNPDSLKYNVFRSLLPGGSAHFPTRDAAVRSPLARRLFEVAGVVGVFIGPDFITLTKLPETSWHDVNEGLAPALEDFFGSGDPVLEGTAAAADMEIGAETADPVLVARIKQLIDEKVRPAVALDGGDIIYRGFDGGVVFLEMMGACNGCPSAGMTLKNGVEAMLMQHLEEVKEVRAI